jgi:hypothetical protein
MTGPRRPVAQENRPTSPTAADPEPVRPTPGVTEGLEFLNLILATGAHGEEACRAVRDAFGVEVALATVLAVPTWDLPAKTGRIVDLTGLDRICANLTTNMGGQGDAEAELTAQAKVAAAIAARHAEAGGIHPLSLGWATILLVDLNRAVPGLRLRQPDLSMVAQAARAALMDVCASYLLRGLTGSGLRFRPNDAGFLETLPKGICCDSLDLQGQRGFRHLPDDLWVVSRIHAAVNLAGTAWDKLLPATLDDATHLVLPNGNASTVGQERERASGAPT